MSSPVASGSKRKDSDGDAAALNVSMDDAVVCYTIHNDQSNGC